MKSNRNRVNYTDIEIKYPLLSLTQCVLYSGLMEKVYFIRYIVARNRYSKTH